MLLNVMKLVVSVVLLIGSFLKLFKHNVTMPEIDSLGKQTVVHKIYNYSLIENISDSSSILALILLAIIIVSIILSVLALLKSDSKTIASLSNYSVAGAIILFVVCLVMYMNVGRKFWYFIFISYLRGFILAKLNRPKLVIFDRL